MVYGARQWATKSFGDGLGAPDLPAPPPPPIVVFGPGTFGTSSIGVAAYGAPAIITPGVTPPVVYTIDLVGALPITGALGPKSQLALVSSMTSSGSMVIAADKYFSGSLASAGTLTMRASDIRITGQITPTGAVHKLVTRSLSSTLTPAGLSHTQTTLVPFDGLLEMTGELEAHRQSQAPFLSATIAPASALLRRALKVFEAGLFPHGTVTLGIQSPGGYAGTIAPQGSLTLTYPNGLTALAQVNLSGRLQLTIARSLTGSIASSSAVQRVSTHSFAGTVTPNGNHTGSGQRSITLSGSVTPAGAYRPMPQKRITASVSSTGALVRTADHLLAGAISGAGSRTMQGPDIGPDSFLMVESVLTMSGSVTNEVTKSVGGTITPHSTTVAIYYEPMVLVPGFVYTKYRRGVLLP